jgi:glucose/arabinose dehydrogenase
MIWLFGPLLALGGCGGDDSGTAQGTPPPAPAPTPTPSPTPTPTPAADDGSTTPSATRPFDATVVATFDEPWAMAFLPNSPRALVTEKRGRLILFDTRSKARVTVTGVPTVSYGGQGGFGDVALAPDPDPADTTYPLYLSWVEAGSGDTKGAVVGLADLVIGGGAARLDGLRIIWRQQPKVTGDGHFSHRIALSPDKAYLFVSSGERQKADPAQDITVNLGKTIRLFPDGRVPPDNPFAGRGGVSDQVWTLGHRNLLGLAFDGEGRLWNSEMGPAGGDEVNLVIAGRNYGWPRASNGSDYDGSDIPDHRAGDGFEPPKAWWNPSISPASLTYYDADLFPAWKNSFFMGALSGEALVRLRIEGDRLVKADHWPMDARIREVEVGPDGALWLLGDGEGANLWKLTPKG